MTGVRIIFIIFVLLAGIARAEIASTLLSNRTTSAMSHDGRIRVSAADSADKLVHIKWASHIIERVEDMVDIPWRIGDRELRIRIRVTESGAGVIRCAQTLSQGSPIQHLDLVNHRSLPRADLDEALCRVMLAAYVLDQKRGSAQAETVSKLDAGDALDSVPLWLSRGVSENLNSARRVRNTDLVLTAWEEGRLPSLVPFLRTEERRDTPDDVTVVFSALIVTRLIMLPKRGKRFAATFKHLADEQSLTPEWLVTMLPGCENLIDLDERWDDWILSQRRRIINLGGLGKRDLDRIRQDLVVHPGDFGVPMSSDWDHVVTFRELIQHRKAPWIPAFTAGRVLSLRTTSLGKDRRLIPVVDAYSAFLDALGHRKRVKKLERLLDEAERAWHSLLAEEKDAAEDSSLPRLSPFP